MSRTQGSRIRQVLGADVKDVEPIQSLWSGYGEIVRLIMQSGPYPSVVYKQIKPPEQVTHPRGWAGARSHQRKWRSYEVELVWYHDFAPRCPDSARVAECYLGQETEDGFELVLEDLQASGYGRRPWFGNLADARVCLDWLAAFHAAFLGEAPTGLWPQGTYWHLETRPDELAAMTDNRLKSAAPVLDARLREARFQTLVHGDAKIANFLLSDERGAAAVDFQYVGGGPGIRDVAYLLGSCLDEGDCQTHAGTLLDDYFAQLRQCLSRRGCDATTVEALEAEWRALYPVAWTDFYRFLQGWSPSHEKIHAYTLMQAQLALD